MNGPVFFPPCSQCIPIKFSKGSQCVPKFVPQDVSNITRVLIPYGFAQSSTPMFITEKVKSMEHYLGFYFAIGVQRGASIGGMPNVPEKFADGPINMTPLKKQIKTMSAPMH